MHAYQKEILTANLEARDREFIEYQVNIDNYRLAIESIGDDADLQPFKEQLQDLLKSSMLEQKKGAVIRDVIRKQLGVDDAV